MSGTQQAAQQQQVDMSRPATVVLPLFMWNAILGCLRTGTGDQFTWDMTNPLITNISNQISQQMTQQSQQGLGGLNSQMQVGQSRLNGEDRDPSAVTNPC